MRTCMRAHACARSTRVREVHTRSARSVCMRVQLRAFVRARVHAQACSCARSFPHIPAQHCAGRLLLNLQIWRDLRKGQSRLHIQTRSITQASEKVCTAAMLRRRRSHRTFANVAYKHLHLCHSCCVWTHCLKEILLQQQRDHHLCKRRFMLALIPQQGGQNNNQLGTHLPWLR